MGLRISDTNKHWVDGLVPYEIDEGDFPVGSANRQKIMDAIAMFNECTNATFAPRTSDPDFARFEAVNGKCSTQSGRSAGANVIGCDLGDFPVGSIAHEMCHELAFHHEHVRTDRDSFVEVSWSMIQTDKCNNFKRKTTPTLPSGCSDSFDSNLHTLLTEDVGVYDYGSIMHYSQIAFRKAGENGDTLTPTNPSTADIGQRIALSEGDVAGINATYSTAAVYVRDNLEDDGEEPLGGGGLHRSPDIVHVTSQPADPQLEFGSAAAMASDTLFQDVEFGQDNFVYVRLQKTGTLTDTASVDVYWTRASTLPTPASWTQIGSTITESGIAPGDVRIVGPFLFNDVPAEGHYCFVAIVHSRKNPAPDLSAIATSDDFHNLVRKKSNVAWKNFEIVDLEEDGDMDMAFRIENMKFVNDQNDVEFDLTELPSTVTSEIRILRRLAEGGSKEKLKLFNESAVYVHYHGTGATGVHALRDMTFQSRESSVVQLNLTAPKGTKHGAYDIHVRQLQDGKEVGRITRRVTIGRFPFIGNIRSKELHRSNCPWIPKMSRKNKRPFTSMEIGLRRGYDGCFTCLREEDHG